MKHKNLLCLKEFLLLLLSFAPREKGLGDEGVLDDEMTSVEYTLSRLWEFKRVGDGWAEKVSGNSEINSSFVAALSERRIESQAGSLTMSIPSIAWKYKLGDRSALEWVLDQYKEKKPKDPTIAKLFNTYRFADYKEQVIDLLKRVCTVSVRTMEIIQQMPDTVEHQGS